jgi:hypothetical protein
MGCLVCVCHSWRSTIEYIWKQQYHSPVPCEAIEYAQNIDPNLRWLPATETEMSQLEKIALKDHSEMWNPGNPERFNFIPARLSQDLSLPESTYAPLQAYHRERSHGTGLPSPSRWLDFGQLRVNPHFLHLLGDRVDAEFGRCEIRLRYDSSEMYSSPLPTKTFEATIGNMFLTH